MTSVCLAVQPTFPKLQKLKMNLVTDIILSHLEVELIKGKYFQRHSGSRLPHFIYLITLNLSYYTALGAQKAHTIVKYCVLGQI